MIIVKTPLRISLVGGGSDLSAFYENYSPGGVVSFTIDKYVYIAVNRKFDQDIRISYSLTENVCDVDCIQHELVRECLLRMGVSESIEIISVADIPGKGTGLGSSSAFVVGLLNALNQYRILYNGDKYEPITDVAEAACEIEIEKCGKPIGKQDQYACAYGGMNYFTFEMDGKVGIERIPLERGFKHRFEDHLLLFWTGRTRASSGILIEQLSNIVNNEHTGVVEDLIDMTKLASKLYLELAGENLDYRFLGNVGKYLHENWMSKIKLATWITDNEIQGWYNAGIDAGAEGGKLCGAGGGGFLLFWAKPHLHEAIKEAVGLRHIPVKIEEKGTSLIYMRGFND